MLGRFSSRTVIFVCLFVALSSLFLRNLVYLGHSKPPVAPAAADQEELPPIVLAYHERPPYYITGSDHFLTGLVGEPALNAFRRSGLQFVPQKMPPKRQLSLVEHNSTRICAVGWFKTTEREQFARFSLPLYHDLPTAVVTRAELTFSPPQPTVTQLLSLPNLIPLTKSAYSYGSHIDQALQEHASAVVTTSGTTAQMLEMVAADKADYFFAAAEEAEVAIAASPTPERFKLLAPADLPPGNTRYLMCSLQVRPQEIELLNAAITAAGRGMGGTAVQDQ